MESDAGKEKNVIEKISANYYSFTVSEKLVADYIMAHISQAQHLSISELAETVGVAEATLSRFCRKLGYKGYNEFRMAFAQAAGEREAVSPLSGEVNAEDSFSEVCLKLCAVDIEAISQTRNLIKPESYKAAADLLEKANIVYCMGQGGSMIIAEEAAHLFNTGKGHYFAVSDSHVQAMTAATARPEDVILFFSYSGATREIMDTLKLAKNRGIKTILVTRYPDSPGAKLADVVLQCGSNESPLQLGSAAARISQLYLLDVLFSEVSRRNLDVCRENRGLIADALAEKHFV